MNRLMWMRFCLLLLLALPSLAGCQHSARVPGDAVPTQQAGAKVDPSQSQAIRDPGPAAAERESGQVTEETWEAYSMQDSVSGRAVRVGYAHTTIASVVEDGRDLIRTRSLIHTSMQRSGQTIIQEMTLTSWDTPDGGLVRFESRMSAGPGEIVSVGAVRGGQLGIDTTTLGRTQSQKIPWQADWGGLFAPEQSLRRMPLKPGEKRSIHSLLPIMNIPAETRLEALDYETVDLPGGKAKLLKVNNIVEIGPQKIESVVWMNEQGETLKSLVPSIGQLAVRTTKADALRQGDGEKFDLLVASTVRLRGKLPNPHETKRAVYRAHVKSWTIVGQFSDCLSQRVKSIDDQTAELTVLAIGPGQPAKLDKPQNPPTDADQAPNNFIQSDDRVIADMAKH